MATQTAVLTKSIPQIRANTRTVGIVLYLLTFLLEIPGALLRFGLVWAAFALLSGINRLITSINLFFFQMQQTFGGSPEPVPPGVNVTSGVLGLFSELLTTAASVTLWVVFAISVGPLLFSAASFFFPGGFFFRRFALNARTPSIREQQMFESARAALTSSKLNPKYPTHLYVLDNNPLLEASVIGSTIYVTRTLLRSEHLVAVLAHSLGHVNSLDGRLTLALRRLVLAPIYIVSNGLGQAALGLIKVSSSTNAAGGCLASGVVWVLSLMLAVAAGGVGMLLLSPAWAWFWRQREYASDDYAVQLGQKEALQQYLEHNPTFDIPVPYLLAQVPSSELRIDRLEYPDARYTADSVNVTPYLAGALLLFVLFCGVPSTLSAVAAARGNISGDYTLVTSCGWRGCEPAAEPLQRTVLSQTEEHLTVLNQGIFITAHQGDTFLGSLEGTFSRLDENTIVVRTQSQQGRYSGYMHLNGAYDIEKRGDRLILKGDTSSYLLVRIGSRAEEEFNAIRETLPTTEKLVGRWRGVSERVQGVELEFMPDGVFRTYTDSVLASEGSYDAPSGQVRLFVGGVAPTYHDASVTDTQLNLEYEEGSEMETFERVN